MAGSHLFGHPGEIGRFYDGQNPGMPLVLRNLPALERLINGRENVVTVLLRAFNTAIKVWGPNGMTRTTADE